MTNKSTQTHKSQVTELLNDNIKSLLNTFLMFKKISKWPVSVWKGDNVDDLQGHVYST